MRVSAFCVLLILAAVAHAKMPTPSKVEDVLRILKAKARATPEDLSAAGADVDGVLVFILSSREFTEEIRARAAWALGGYPGNRARAVLVTTFTNTNESDSVRTAAMSAYAKVQGAVAIADLKPYLKDERPAIRMGAAKALALIGNPEVRVLLEDAIEHEDTLEVRLAMEEALREVK